jgi:hypothetical protein
VAPTFLEMLCTPGLYAVITNDSVKNLFLLLIRVDDIIEEGDLLEDILKDRPTKGVVSCWVQKSACKVKTSRLTAVIPTVQLNDAAYLLCMML